MSTLQACIEGVALLGPGLADWDAAQPVFAGRTRRARDVRTVLPPPAGLPPAERRRTGAIVKLALAVGHAAAAASGRTPASLATVFASSSSDGENCHAICATLASDDRMLSPTRFHNSVHNAPAGYWSISAHAMTPSNVLSAYDGSFSAGLLESVCQLAADARQPVLLIAADADYPQPLHAARPVPDAFGVALVLAADATDRASQPSRARIALQLTDAPATPLADPDLEALRSAHPAARALPLLAALAERRAASVVLDYLPDLRLQVDIAPAGSDGARAS